MKATMQTPMDATNANIRRKKAYTFPGALLVFLPVVPIVATIISIAVYVGPNLKASGHTNSFTWLVAITPLLVGTLPTLLLWFLFAYFFRPFTAVFSADEKSYNALLNHLSTVDAYIDVDTDSVPAETKIAAPTMPPDAKRRKPGIPGFRWLLFRLSSGAASVQPGASAPSGTTSVQPSNNDVSAIDAKQEVRVAKQEILRCRKGFDSSVMQSSASWILGNGYIELWDWMDSAEEALITFAPMEKVVHDAVYDDMRLSDSKIENSEEWANKLRSALKVLDPDAVHFLKPAVTAQSSEGIAEAQQQARAANESKETETQRQADARAILRDVRETINDFNKKSWGGLISARNQLLSTMIFVGLTTYVFVELAIIFQVKPVHIEVATFIAFIGGLAGLISRLSTETQTDQGIDDYGLSTARLMVTPLLSGLAAVIGVLIVAKTSVLDDIYNFNNSTVSNLIIAATFGLTPNLLINQLKKKSDEYKANLQSTQPTSGK